MKHLNKTLLAVAIAGASSTASAAPFFAFDARSLGMGGAGVAASKVAHSTYFNPSLLANAEQDDDFGLVLPQGGAYISDEDKMVSAVDDFTDSTVFDDFSNTVDGLSASFGDILDDLNAIEAATQGTPDVAAFNAAKTSFDANLQTLTDLGGSNGQLSQNITSLNSELNNISGRAMRAGLGGGASLAIPSKKFAGAISVHNSTILAGQLIFSPTDAADFEGYGNALGAYVSAANDYNDALVALDTVIANNDVAGLPAATAAVDTAKSNIENFSYTDQGNNKTYISNNNLDVDTNLASEVQFIAAGITDIGISLAKQYNISGHDIAFGVTPKLQRIDIYDYRFELDGENFDIADVLDGGETLNGFNIDFGASYRMPHGKNNIILGGVVKNLLGGEFKSDQGTKISTDLQARVGASYEGSWYTVTSDLDLLENNPIAFETPTQYFSLGGEINVKILQLRAGYRSNLASDEGVYTFGLGLFNLVNVALFTSTFSADEIDDGASVGGMIELDLSF